MKKSLLLSTVCISFLYADVGTHKLDPVVTLATRTESNISNLPSHVEVITQEEIQNSGFVSTADILQNSVSIQTSPDGSRVSLRGMSHSDTLLLIDGRRIIGEVSKAFELERIPAGMIERIEILKGSGSVLYGSEAMGGVINIITKQPTEKLAGEGSVIHGQDRVGANMFIGGKVGDSKYKFHANHLTRKAYGVQRSANIKVMQGGVEISPSLLVGGPNSAIAPLRNNLQDSYTVTREFMPSIEVLNLGGALSHRFNSVFEAGVDISYLDEKKSNSFISERYASNHTQGNPPRPIMTSMIPAHENNKNDRIQTAAFARINPLENMEILYDVAYAKYNKDRAIYTPLFKELGYSSEEDSLSGQNQTVTTSVIHNIMGTYKFSDSNKLSVGAEHRDRKNESAGLNVSRENKAVFAQHELKAFDDLGLVYGARYDKDSIGEAQLSGSFGGNYKLTKDTKLRANFAQGFKSPDDRDLFVARITPNGRFQYGSTVISDTKTDSWELRAEKSETMEIGLTTKGEFYKFDTSIYRTDVRDKIERVVIGTGQNQFQTFKNIDNVKIDGIESSLTLFYKESFSTKLYYMALDARNKANNEKLLFTPSSAAGLTMSYFFNDGMELRSITKYMGSQLNERRENIDPYSLTNLKFISSNVVENLDLFAGVDNIFKKTLDDAVGLVPGAYYYVGAKYSF